ncbi:MAG: ribonuclease HII [bacterium]|jgi:ribonuclease HII
MSKTVLGIDEAGRGPVLGPMVLAGVVVPTDQEFLLEEWGVTDSKVFGSQAKGKRIRKELSEKIRAHFKFSIYSISAQEIDQRLEKRNLNQIEQDTAQAIINDLTADEVVLDGCRIFQPLTVTNSNVRAEKEADLNYLSVGAASILAKVVRDETFEILCEPFCQEFGEIKGGGYPNNGTFQFVKWYWNENGALPDFYRTRYQWKKLNKFLSIT